MDELAPEVGDAIKPLLADNDQLFASLGLRVLVSVDGGTTFELRGTCPGLRGEAWASGSRLGLRLGRLGVHALRVLPDGGLVAILRRRIAWIAPGEQRFREVLRIERGSRPLDLCRTPGGRVAFGEYFNNPRRESVHIYISEDGENWSVAYTFPPGSVRHVHNLIPDPYREGVWVLTGDNGDEAGLWFTADEFKTLDCVIRGTQRVRAVSLIPLRDGLILPTDTPSEQNYVQYFDPESTSIETLAPLPSSAFHAVRFDDLMLISTVAEPSPVNDIEAAAVVASCEGSSWQPVARLTRDWPWIRGKHRFVDRAIRHPEIQLVPGSNTTDHIFAYGRAIRNADGKMLRWSRAQVRDHLLRSSAQVGGERYTADSSKMI